MTDLGNVFGKNDSIFRNVVLRRTTLKDDVIIGDDTFVTDSKLGNKVIVERRCMVFNSNIGDYTSIGWNSVVRNATIGKYCSIAWSVTIGGGEHNMHHLTTHFFPLDKKYGFLAEDDNPSNSVYDKPLTIGNDVWIAANAQILRGVSISDGAVIGAGAVVTHNVGPYEIWAGVPAKKIGQRFSDEIINELLELKWWNNPEEIIKDNIQLFRKDITIEDVRKMKEMFNRYDR